MSDIECSPSENIKEYLNDRGWTQGELSRRTGLTTKTISYLCNDKAKITARVALCLEKVFQRPARFWMMLQAEYDLKRARTQLKKRHGKSD